MTKKPLVSKIMDAASDSETHDEKTTRCIRNRRWQLQTRTGMCDKTALHKRGFETLEKKAKDFLTRVSCPQTAG